MDRRTFLFTLGSLTLGRFRLPERVAETLAPQPLLEERSEAERVRQLILPPSWSPDGRILVWTEMRGDDAVSMMWEPTDEEEWAEARRFVAAATYRRWNTLEDLAAILEEPGPWLIRLNMFGVLKFLMVNREELLFGVDDSEDGPDTLTDLPLLAATFSSEEALAYIPRLGEEWLQGDEDYYFEPVRPSQALKDYRLEGLE